MEPVTTAAIITGIAALGSGALGAASKGKKGAAAPAAPPEGLPSYQPLYSGDEPLEEQMRKMSEFYDQMYARRMFGGG